jgi:hypothetical protein
MAAAMFKMLTLVILLAISGTCRAQTVTLSIVRLGCGIPLSPLFPPPKSQQEREQITAEWVEPDELVVESWDNESADSQVDPGKAKVHVDGATLTLSYAHRRVVLDRSKPVAECQFLVKLFFTISGLTRSHYRLRIDGGNGVVRPTEIDG